ncbi:MAG: sulfatase-like hydrolase/transferase [Candidatus Omnitrophica bacterium]|nr:sulfatase-like hydrolase/transferase [Candidatus Omnitrophota bacterium]
MNNQSRRDFIKTSVVAAAATASWSSTTARKPNLLFIWTDEQRPDTMAVYGNPNIHAPNLNKLAKESVVFQRAYCTQPVCTPSRSSIMTGLWPHTNGCVKNNIPLKEETPCLPELLADPDYRTAYMGKWHLGDEIFPQHGFQEWVGMEDGYSKYYRSDRDQNARSAYHHFLIDHGYEPDTSSGKFSRGFAARRPLEHCKPKFLESQARDFIRRNRNDPFILHVNFLEPHMPFFGPLDEEHTPEEVTLPKNLEDPLEDNEPLRYRLMRQHFAQEGWHENPLKTEEDWRDLIRKYWGLVTQVDLSVGGILEELEKQGLADDTIVVYTSDHGDMMGSHRLLTKTVMYEESSRIPWLIRVPGKNQRVFDRSVSQIDMVPTLLDLMGAKELSEGLPGQSLAPLMAGEDVAEDHVFIEWNATGSERRVPDSFRDATEAERIAAFDASIRTVVSPDGWKLCLSTAGDKSQLFNLGEDPFETANLFDSGNHPSMIDRLSKRIHEWQKKVGDTVEV